MAGFEQLAHKWSVRARRQSPADVVRSCSKLLGSSTAAVKYLACHQYNTATRRAATHIDSFLMTSRKVSSGPMSGRSMPSHGIETGLRSLRAPAEARDLTRSGIGAKKASIWLLHDVLWQVFDEEKDSSRSVPESQSLLVAAAGQWAI